MLNKYFVLIRMKWIEMFEYRAESVIWIAGALTQPLITMAVWLGISSGVGVGGFSSEQFILYFASLILVERMTASWDVWELDREIRHGTISFHLLKPLHPIHWAIAENIVYKAFFLFILIPLWGIAAMFVPPLRLSISFSQGVAFVLAVVLALAIRFLLGWCVGLLGFWVSRVAAIYSVLEGISLFFSGRIAPLSIMPPLIQEIGKFLPFSSMIYFPVNIMMGHATGEKIILGLAAQLVWILILVVLFRLLWQAGVKAYHAVGG